MSETLDATNTTPGQRPTFLTVLCILSFISAGIAIIVLLLGTAAMGVVSSGAVDAELTTEQSATLSEAKGVIANIWLYLGLAIAMVVVSLIGVIQMWKLKKSGFYLYTGAAVAGVIVDIAVGSGFNAVGLIFTIAFVVMYGVNLKHMR